MSSRVPFLMSQAIALLSTEPDRMKFESGDHERSNTPTVCPLVNKHIINAKRRPEYTYMYMAIFAKHEHGSYYDKVENFFFQYWNRL